MTANIIDVFAKTCLFVIVSGFGCRSCSFLPYVKQLSEKNLLEILDLGSGSKISALDLNSFLKGLDLGSWILDPCALGSQV